MSGSDEVLKKHRHDLGHEDHGPKLAAGTTKAIQALLGIWITLTVALIVYTMWDGVRGPSSPVPARIETK
jgi:hypothetical protein